MVRKRISTIIENETGRNLAFHDNFTGRNMSRAQFISEIESGNYANYHVRKINGIKTPVSNPDKTDLNNLD
jgi:hypothetical protein